MATEKRLTDANALLAEVVKAQSLEPDKAIAKIITLLTEAESVDAVEVVRCDECVYSPNGWVCLGNDDFMPRHPTYPDRYCSCGRRRTDNGC
jgi:hypothetical protein